MYVDSMLIVDACHQNAICLSPICYKCVIYMLCVCHQYYHICNLRVTNILHIYHRYSTHHQYSNHVTNILQICQQYSNHNSPIFYSYFNNILNVCYQYSTRVCLQVLHVEYDMPPARHRTTGN